MTSDKKTYLRCPHCGKFQEMGRNGKRPSRRAGLYRIMELHNNIWIIQCAGCRRTFRKMTVGSMLLEADMSPVEKSVFKSPQIRGALNKKFKQYLEGGE